MKKIISLFVLFGMICFIPAHSFASDDVDIMLEEMSEEELMLEEDMIAVPALTDENREEVRKAILKLNNDFDPEKDFDKVDEIYTYLAQWGIDNSLYKENDDTYTHFSPMMYFVSRGYDKLVAIGNNFSPKLHMKDHKVKNGYTNLLIECSTGFGTLNGTGYVEWLLDKGGYKKVINYHDNYGETALHRACTGFISQREGAPHCYVYPSLVQLLIKNGANVNAQDNEGKTPLMKAILTSGMGQSQEAFEIIKILLNSGARVLDIRDKSGYTAFQYAAYMETCPKEIMKYIFNVSANRGY